MGSKIKNNTHHALKLYMRSIPGTFELIRKGPA